MLRCGYPDALATPCRAAECRIEVRNAMLHDTVLHCTMLCFGALRRRMHCFISSYRLWLDLISYVSSLYVLEVLGHLTHAKHRTSGSPDYRRLTHFRTLRIRASGARQRISTTTPESGPLGDRVFSGKATYGEMRGFAGREKQPRSGASGTANQQPTS